MTKRPHLDDGKPGTIDEPASLPDEAVTDGVVMHWPESEESEKTLAASPGAPSKVKGPIRCHKCQLKCRDADHYLRHKCEPRRRKT
jgi:hypothetical protein